MLVPKKIVSIVSNHQIIKVGSPLTELSRYIRLLRNLYVVISYDYEDMVLMGGGMEVYLVLNCQSISISVNRYIVVV